MVGFQDQRDEFVKDLIVDGYGGRVLTAPSSPSQARQADAGRMTGMRLWIGAISSFGGPVMMVKVWTDHDTFSSRTISLIGLP